MRVLIFAALFLSGCKSSSVGSIGEMMALTAQGEAACVRNDVVVRGREECRKTQ
jgi:hypothetical protein